MIVCTRCGASNQPTSKFCLSCGNPLAAAAAPPPGHGAPPAQQPQQPAASGRLVRPRHSRLAPPRTAPRPPLGSRPPQPGAYAAATPATPVERQQPDRG